MTNAARQRDALKKMTVCEIETGLTAEQLDQFHAEQRALVLGRLAA